MTLVRWLDKDKGLSVTLTPDRDGDGMGDALEGGVEADYTVTIYTSDIRWEGGGGGGQEEGYRSPPHHHVTHIRSHYRWVQGRWH